MEKLEGKDFAVKQKAMKEWSNPEEEAEGDDDNDDDGGGDEDDGGGDDPKYEATSLKLPCQSQHSLRKLYHDASSGDGLEMQRKSSQIEHQSRPSSHRPHRSHHLINLHGHNLRHDGHSNTTQNDDMKRGELFQIMKRQNEITELLFNEQQHSLLPKEKSQCSKALHCSTSLSYVHLNMLSKAKLIIFRTVCIFLSNLLKDVPESSFKVVSIRILKEATSKQNDCSKRTLEMTC